MIIDWAEQHVTSTLFSCWAAHAALYHRYNLKRDLKEDKLCGVFTHQCYFDHGALTRGFDDTFLVPHSRYGHIDINKINACDDIVVLAGSEKVGAYLMKNKSGSQVFITGHPEYDADTLKAEYERDLQKVLMRQNPKTIFQITMQVKSRQKRGKAMLFCCFRTG